jgi:uncharacterized repeat protein (TIGR02543 family)
MHTQWTAIAYTVQYNANGGGGTMTPSAHTYDTAKGLTDNGFVRSGYSFKEWAAAPNGSGAVYPNGGSVVNLSSADGAAVDLYAQWTAIEYSIDYKLDGGKNDDANPATYTIETAIPLAAPKRDGYDFGGWYDNSGFTGSAVTGIPAGSTEAKTFYARWDPLAPIETTLLQPAADPVLTAKVVFAGDTDTFTAVGDYTNHEWYWDGVLQSGQTGPTYTLTGKEEAGIYELSVVVTGEGDKPLSARCKVTIKAKN